MAISIMNNSTALGAMGNLNNTNSKLSKTISQLSSGFRINSAADDASGLAVSEKLRGQISGLSKAASNAQDGISMLQTAEGAMGSMTSIVQRMRELAVQAGDPAYTTNDRAMLQLEVDQLKEEINRVSSTTEFNTKKLLNGNAAAIWSSSSADVEAIVRGAPAEGNYKVETLLSGGQNDIYKTNVMSMKDGVQSVDEATAGRAVGIKAINNVSGMMATGTAANSVPRVGVEVASSAAIAAGSAAMIGSVGATGGVTLLAGTFDTTGATTAGYIEMKADTSRAASGRGIVKMRFVDAATGQKGEWKNVTITSAGRTNSAAGTSVTLATGVVITAGTSFLNAAADTFKAGDTALFGVTAAKAVGTATQANVTVGTGGTVAGSTVGTGGYTIRLTAAVSATKEMTHTLHTAQINTATGTIAYGKMDIVFEKNTAVQATGALSGTNATGIALNVSGPNGAASKWTQLKDITAFTNADGRNLLANNQAITIYGNNKQAVVNLEGTDTIADLEAKLTSAIVDQLGMGYGAAGVDSNLVNFVKSGTAGATANTNESVPGTFVIQSALLGKDSKLSFIGDQGVMNALGIVNIQDAKDSQVTVKVSDAHSGNVIGEDTVGDNILRGVIKGIDVKVQPVNQDTVTATWNAATKRIDFATNANGQTSYLHIANNATVAAIGPNEGQTLDISIGEMSTKSLEIDSVNVVDIPNAQASITKLDQALEKISASRAKVGAQMNRLDYTINNLNNARENLTASESRIRDLDIAQASSDLASRQVLMQSATAMLAQANQLPSYAAQLLR